MSGGWGGEERRASRVRLPAALQSARRWDEVTEYLHREKKWRKYWTSRWLKDTKQIRITALNHCTCVNIKLHLQRKSQNIYPELNPTGVRVTLNSKSVFFKGDFKTITSCANHKRVSSLVWSSYYCKAALLNSRLKFLLSLPRSHLQYI